MLIFLTQMNYTPFVQGSLTCPSIVEEFLPSKRVRLHKS